MNKFLENLLLEIGLLIIFGLLYYIYQRKKIMKYEQNKSPVVMDMIFQSCLTEKRDFPEPELDALIESLDDYLQNKTDHPPIALLNLYMKSPQCSQELRDIIREGLREIEGSVDEKNNYISPKGHQKLVDELEQLLRIERPEVTRLVQWAASNGDRSENADYLYGKRRLREIDRRIRFLSKRLDAAVIVDPLKMNSKKIQFGATVEIVDEEGVEKTFTIVGVDEVDTSKGHISWQSPIGKTLIGKEEGDEVLIRVPAGEHTFEVVRVQYNEIT